MKSNMDAEAIVPNKIQKKSEELQEELKGARKKAKDKRYWQKYRIPPFQI